MLEKRVRLLESVIHISKNGQVTIGTEDNPVDVVYTKVIGSVSQPVDTINTVELVDLSFATKGICLDDGTAVLTPSFSDFPRQWLNNTLNIGSVRTYHYGTEVDDRPWVLWLMQQGVKVMIGITLGAYQTELALLQSDYVANKPLFDANTLAIAVGNEQPSSAIQLIQTGITQAVGLRAQGLLPNVPITTVLKDDGNWLQNTFPPANATFTENFLTLAPSLDIFCFNMYDGLFATGAPINVRLSWATPSVTLNGFGAIRFAMGKSNYQDKKFWCTEVGWNTTPPNTVAQLSRFYSGFIQFNTQAAFTPEDTSVEVQPPNRIFYFTIRDTGGETFGLYTANTNTLVPKF